MSARNIGSKEHYFLDLFAGSGGFTLGLESSGFTSLGSIEINPVARKTLELNFNETPFDSVRLANGDVTRVDLQKLKRELRSAGIGQLDLLVACPPCQAFSRIGRGKLDSLAGARGSSHADPRNLLYRTVIKYLSVLKPKAFVFENVPGMLSVGGTNVAELMCKGAERAGFEVRAALLNAAWFGVPQLRERIIIIGFNKELGITPEFPSIAFDGDEIDGHMSGSDRVANLWKCPDYFVPYSKLPRSNSIRPFRCVEDALGDLPVFTEHLKALRSGGTYKTLRTAHSALPYGSKAHSDFSTLMRTWDSYQGNGLVTDHFCRWTPRDYETFREMKPGDTYPEALRIAKTLYEEAKRRDPKAKRSDYIPPYSDKSFEEKWRKLIRKKPSWTVTAHLSKDTYSHIHYDSRQARAITIREAARLQSFPDGFRFHGNTGDAYRQIGNAVPPLLSRQIGLSLAKQLDPTKTAVRRVNPHEVAPRKNQRTAWISNRDARS